MAEEEAQTVAQDTTMVMAEEEAEEEAQIVARVTHRILEMAEAEDGTLPMIQLQAEAEAEEQLKIP